MATCTTALVLLLLAATVLLHPASLLACSNCPPTTPGCGGHCPPSYPAPGGGAPPTWPSPGSGTVAAAARTARPTIHKPPCNPPYVAPYIPLTPPNVPAYVPPTPPASRTCPIDTLNLNACVDVLSGLLRLVIGQEARAKCCPLVQGVADLDAALCLCTSLRLRLLNLKIYLPIALNLLIACGKHAPPDFQCPPLYD